MLDKAKLTRRSFAKLSASMAVAGLVGGAVRGEALAAVEEPESREKVERIRTCCRGCGKMECLPVVAQSRRTRKDQMDFCHGWFIRQCEDVAATLQYVTVQVVE